MRRPLAILLAALMAVLDPALRVGPVAGKAFAADPKPAAAPSVDAKEAIAFLEQNKVFKGPDDPLRTYVAQNGKLTAIGEVIYQYLRRDTQDRVRDFAPTFDQLRQAGNATPKMVEAAAQSQKEIQQRFGDLFKLFEENQAPGGGKDHSFEQTALLSVSFDGAARARPEAQYTQMQTADSFVFMDDEGVAVRMAKNWACRNRSWAPSSEPLVMNKPQYDAFEAKHRQANTWDEWICGEQGGVTTFSRDIKKSQEAMNRSPGKPACAPRVPETGRYNFEMLDYSACLLIKDTERSRLGYKIDLLVKLATMLQESVTEDMILKNTDSLLEKLTKKAQGKRLDKFDQYCGKVVSTVWDLATCKLAKRDEYVKKAEEFLAEYQKRVKAFKGREVITQSEIQGLQADEALVKKYLTLAYLEAQRGQAYSQLEGISWEVFQDKDKKWVVREVKDSPDSKALRDALDKGPFDAKTKADYMKRGGEIAQRLRRLLEAYGKLEEELLKADHAAPMGILQGGLLATQKELGETGLDSRIFSAVPIMTHMGNEENSGWSRSTYYGIAKGVNWLGRLVGADPASGYIKDRNELDKAIPQLKRLASLVAAGDFRGAREAILKLDPDAQKTHWQAEAGSSGDDPSRAERTEAVLRKLNETVTRTMKTHMWADIARDIVVSSVVLAVAAPAFAAVLTGVAKTAFSVANAVGTATKTAKVISTAARIIGGVAEHTAIRLQSLSPAANTLRQKTLMGRVLTATAVRGINAGVRHAVFALGMSGGVSGGINWAMHEIKSDSPYKSGGQAFAEGYKAGAKWGAGNAWILYAGLPNTAFEETALSGAANSLANRGLLGNTAAAGQWGLGKLGIKTGENIVDRGMAWAMGKGAAGSVGGTVLSMGDQFAKYYAFNQFVGGTAETISWRFNSIDGNDVERRIKRAQAAGMHAMEMPYWALIPTFSAKTALQVEQMQRSRQGFAEYKKSGELDRVANAAADIAELPLKQAPKRPFINRLFEFNLMEATGEKGSFKVTKEMKYEAIRLELESSVSGGKGKANPFDYFRISQQEGGMTGRLHITDEVRDQAQGLFEKSVLENPRLAEQILRAQPGSKLEGFGRVRLGHQEEVSRVLFSSERAGKAVPKAQLELARGVLEPYLKTEEHVSVKATDMLKALKEAKSPSPAYQKFVDGMLEKTQAWKSDPVRVKKVGYMDLVAEFKADAAAQKGALAPAEVNVITKMMDYLESIHSRFNHFNHVGTASQRAETALGALRAEAKTGGATSPVVGDTIDMMLTKLSEWKNAQSNLEMAVPDSYKQMVSGFKQTVEGLKGKLTTGDFSLLKTAVNETEAAPWLLRNAQNRALPGWRPEQFEGLMHFLRSVSVEGSATSEVIRTFMLMKTGGGKTLLAYEGLLPIAEADAVLHGSKKLKTIFLTVQSNLESQARVDFRSSKKLLTDLQIDTWEGFKSKIAEKKLAATGGADEYWILGDEMDGAALQPALTIGEQTAGIGKENTGYRLLKNISNRMKEVLDRGPAELRRSVSDEARKQQAFVDAMEPSEVQARLRGTTEELVSLSDRMSAMQRKGDVAGLDRLSKRVSKVLETQNQLLKGMDEASAKGILESGSRIAETVQNRNLVGAADWKMARTLFADMLREQEAVVNQTAPMGRQQAKTLQRLAKIQRAEGNVTEAVKLEAQANKILSEAKTARAGLDANALQFKELLREGKPGWEQAARKLIAERSQLVEKTVVKENPIYETFRRMREDMYSLVHSKLRTTQTWELLSETPGRTAQTLEKAAEAFSPPSKDLIAQANALRNQAHGQPAERAASLRAQAEKLLSEARAKAPAYEMAKRLRREALGKPPAEAQALLQRAQDIISQADARAALLRAQAAKVRTELTKPLNAEQQAAYEARAEAQGMLMRAEKNLQQFRAELKSAGPSPSAELLEGLKAAESEAGRWRADYQKANAKVTEFEGTRVQAARQVLNQLQLEAANTSKSWTPRLEGLKGPEADGMRRALASLETSFTSQSKRLEWTPERAVDVLQRRITGVTATEYVARTALRYSGTQWLLSNIPGVKETKWARPMTQADVGLTRTYARELMKQFMSDPFLPPQVRWKMLWTLSSSTIWPRGMTGRGSSWVMTELLNLATGYTDNPANIRMDNITGRVNVIHNGQWFDSMDTPTRRFWELEYKSDLTLPYDHKTQVTMNDFVRDNLNVRFVGFSGTAGQRFREYLGKYQVNIAGVGSAQVKDVGLQLHEGPAGKFKAIGDAVREAMKHDAAQIAAGGQGDALVVLSLPDTRTVKAVRNYLLKTGAIKADQIAMVFSDSEMLRINRPEANVAQQMNLKGLEGGKVKLLILDTRVGGRGLDLNFKGKDNPGPGDFGGYFKFKMLVVDPQLASEAHFLQAQGRIDLGRIHSSIDPKRVWHPEAATREFTMVMDLEAAQTDPVFMRMLRSEPIFQQLRSNARVNEIASANGRYSPSWTDINTFVQEAKRTGKEGFVTGLYEETVRKYLAEKQLQVELDQLRSAGVLNEAGSFDPALYGLHPVMPGTPYPGMP